MDEALELPLASQRGAGRRDESGTCEPRSKGTRTDACTGVACARRLDAPGSALRCDHARHGRRLASELLERDPSLLVLFASGYSADILDIPAVRSERVEFLAKPFSPTALLHVVRRLLERDSTTATL